MSAAMQNQLKDYYSTLGVDEDAEEKTIKDAYRRLARKWHPDSNKDDPDAEERFKEVAEAWAVLGDAQKRREYDLARSGQGVFEFDPSDLFGDGLGSIFGSLFGGGGGFNGGGARMQTIIHQRISRRVPARLLLKGGTLNVDGRAVEVPPLTPAEVVLQERTPSRILEIELEPFVPEGLVDGADIHIVRKVPYTTLALGGDLDVEGIEGSLTVTVKPGTPGGSRLRLQDQGLPHYRGGRGALFVLVETAVPEQPSDEVRTQLERLRELGL